MSEPLDPIASPLAGDLLAALMAGYDAAEILMPCAVGLISGGNLIADHCCASESADGEPCEGQLTVRITNVYPTRDFPQPFLGGFPTCGMGYAVEFEVAVLRCALVPDSQGVPPPMADELVVAERALGDAGLIRKVARTFARERDQAVAIGQYTPMGPDGGCVGGAVQITYLVE